MRIRKYISFPSIILWLSKSKSIISNNWYNCWYPMQTNNQKIQFDVLKSVLFSIHSTKTKCFSLSIFPLTWFAFLSSGWRYMVLSNDCVCSRWKRIESIIDIFLVISMSISVMLFKRIVNTGILYFLLWFMEWIIHVSPAAFHIHSVFIQCQMVIHAINESALFCFDTGTDDIDKD